MEVLSHLRTALTKPSLLVKRTPLFLLSHMRANTSLFGHILGSHAQVDGYYEMHMGYYSWKSFIRQRLIYYKNHPVKPRAEYLFDKVLHDYYHLNVELLISNKARIMFSLREPVQTIKSAVNQFRNKRPGHEFCYVKNVTDYYVERLDTLCSLAKQFPSYFYYDADMLRKNPQQVLGEMTEWLGLGSPLVPEFDSFHFSGGKGSAGDKSGRLSLGKVDTTKSDYSDIELPGELIREAELAYKNAFNQLESGADNR